MVVPLPYITLFCDALRVGSQRGVLFCWDGIVSSQYVRTAEQETGHRLAMPRHLDCFDVDETRPAITGHKGRRQAKQLQNFPSDW